MAIDKKIHFNLSYVFAALLGVWVLQSLIADYGRIETVPYSQFEQMLKDGKLSEVGVGQQSIQGTLKSDDKNAPQKFVVAQRVEPGIAAELDHYGVRYYALHESTFLRDLMSWVAPAVFFYLLWVFVFRRMMDKQMPGGGLLSIGKSKAKVFVESDTKVSFADVAGVDEAKTELQEIVDFLKDRSRYERLGARLPKGVLLVGPPGTGKTLLARAVAGEAGVPFFSINGSEFVEMFVGVGAARVRDLFEQARQTAPAIIFIDELDALGRARMLSPMTGGVDEKEQTLNQLLSEMDGFDPRQGLVLLAATNRPEILDPALLRAGRFDRQVLVDRPDRLGRKQILKVHIKKIRLAGDVDIDKIAAMTPGFTGADLANLINEAALLATRRSAAAVDFDDFTQAIERIVAGLEKKNRLMNVQERRAVAYHELGHAFVAMSLSSSDPVRKVSIIPRGVAALGYTIQRPTEDRYLMTRTELTDKMAVLLGGRAAEQLVFGEASTGAADDLAKATDIARSMVTRFGMAGELGQVAYEDTQTHFLAGQGAPPAARAYSDETAHRIDDAVRLLIDRAFEQASDILRRLRPTLDLAAQRLLISETLVENELRDLLPQAALPAPAATQTG